MNNVFTKLELKKRIYIKILDDIRIKKNYLLLIRKSLYRLIGLCAQSGGWSLHRAGANHIRTRLGPSVIAARPHMDVKLE